MSDSPRTARRRKISVALAGLSAAAMAVLGIQAPAQAATAVAAAAPAAASPHGKAAYEPSCATPKAGEFTCFALHRTDVKAAKGVQPNATTPSGFGAGDLQSAYSLPADGGAGQTVAIVDAYDDPTAEADLAVYRAQYGLSACTTDNGCFKKVDQRGGTSYPAANSGWAGEISLDLDMVSAAAPNAKIILVEADSASFEDLGTAVNQAVALGAKYVSNSYGTGYDSTPGSGEDPSETTVMDAYYNHPGVAVVASSGDSDYGVSYPAASQYVTSVGGTALVKDTTTPRGWTESVWHNSYGGPGSGCSIYEPKPSFQHDTGCDKRAVADVSAVSDPVTGVSVYQTYGGSGWSVYGGTSAASPLIAGVYAAAGTPAAGSYPNAYPYAGSGAGLNDVTTGANGTCTPAYLCTAGAGYDGPTGLGTPNGLTAFRSGPHGEVSGSITDKATGKGISGATVSVGDSQATTAADGTYTVTVPAGTYDVSATAFGYKTATASGVAVEDGATVTESFALDAIASRSVAGKVTDGSGHGWPLYAKITVDGVSGGTWTDPTTGAYQLSLPEGKDYTLHVTVNNPGYKATSKTVTVGSADQTVNLPVKIDAFAGTTPGYQVGVDGTNEPFDSTTAAPEGWSVVNADGTTGGWEFDDPGNRGNKTGGSGAFAIVDSDHAGSGKTQDSQLLTPVYDFTGKADPELDFNTYYQSFSGQTATIDATSDGGATWTNVWSATSSIAANSRITVPLSAFADKSAVQLRFHFTSKFGWYWQVDNVLVGQRTVTATPGGLVVGTVKDANTKGGVVGATVTNADDSAQTATTVATPDDPNLPDGYYSIFSKTLGSHSFTAAKAKYVTVSKAVKVAADSAVAANYTLKAGHVTVTPATVDTSVKWGAGASKNVTLKNTGGAPATVKLGEQPGGFTMQKAGKGAPLQNIKGDYSPLSSKANAGKAGAKPAAQPSDDAWQSVPNYPVNIMDNAAGRYNGKIYSAFGYNGTVDTKDMYILDPEAGSWTKAASASDTREAPAHGFIDGKFYAAGGWGADGQPDAKTEIYDPASDSWSTGASSPKPYAGAGSAVLDGKLYVVGGCTDSCGTTDATVYDASSNSWDTIASYPESISWSSCAGLSGKLYCAGGTNATGDVAHSYVYDPSDNTWSPIADMPTAQWGSAHAGANGLLVVSSGVSGNALTNRTVAYDPSDNTWHALPNANTPSYRSGGAVGFYKVGGGVAPQVPGNVSELLPGYDQEGSSDVTWLTESTNQVTLAPGASTVVKVSVDASVPEITQPGAYTAKLALNSDTPYSLDAVPVTMTVAPPATWGKITGKILGEDGKGGTAPIAGATVQIDSWATSYTLKTKADGTYALWLDVRNNPLTVIVAKDGFQPTVKTLKITKGGTLTADFTLKKG